MTPRQSKPVDTISAFGSSRELGLTEGMGCTQRDMLSPCRVARLFGILLMALFPERVSLDASGIGACKGVRESFSSGVCDDILRSPTYSRGLAQSH